MKNGENGAIYFSIAWQRKSSIQNIHCVQQHFDNKMPFNVAVNCFPSIQNEGVCFDFIYFSMRIFVMNSVYYVV